MVTPPPVAVTVTVEVPVTAEELADSVNVRLPLPGAAMVVELKLLVTPAGRPLTDKVMAELNPEPAVVVTVIGAEPLRATLALEALRDSVKVGNTVRVRD